MSKHPHKNAQPNIQLSKIQIFPRTDIWQNISVRLLDWPLQKNLKYSKNLLESSKTILLVHGKND